MGNFVVGLKVLFSLGFGFFGALEISFGMCLKKGANLFDCFSKKKENGAGGKKNPQKILITRRNFPDFFFYGGKSACFKHSKKFLLKQILK